jgi:hypothetical protein
VQLEVSLGQSLAACGCSGCGRVFTGITAFDRHQRWAQGKLTCLDPATLGMERKRDGKWGYPAPAKLPHFADSVNFSGLNGPRPVSLDTEAAA